MPQRFGRFTVLGELGAGGVGRVYRAHDPTLGREVAIKVLQETSAGPRGDLVAEARAASALNHPGICTIYDVGEVDGAPYVAMELVAGRQLSERIGVGALPLATGLRYGLETAAALAHAHERGVVHGDLKGRNILITREDHVKLLDFGLARRVDPVSVESLTRLAPAGAVDGDGAIAGTLPYMAPETLRGAALAPPADVWAFGVLLQELLSGSRPFGGTTPYDTAAAILTGSPQPLPASIPSGVAAVVARCLEKEPARRYANAREVFVALEPLVSGDATGRAVSPHATPPRATLPVRRRTVWVAVAISAAALAIAAGTLWRWPSLFGLRPAPGSLRVSSLMVLPFDVLSTDPDDGYFADGMTEALITNLSRIPSLTVISRTSSIRYKALQKSTREIGRELGVGAVVDGTVSRSANQVRIGVRLVDAATDRIVWGREYTRELKDVLQLQGEVARAVAAEISAAFAPGDLARLTHAPPVDPRVHAAFVKGRHHWNRRTIDGLTQAIAEFQRALDLQPNYAPALAGLAQSYVLLPAFPLGAMAPDKAFPLAIDAAQRAIAQDDGLAEAPAALGYARLYTDGFTAAEPAFRRALAANPGDATTHFWYAAALASAGRIDEAIDHARRATTLDPVSPIVAAGLAWVHHLARHFDQEIETARFALTLEPNFMMARYRLGEGYLHEGRFAEASVELELARGLAGGSLDLEAAVGYAYGRAGRRREALAVLRSLTDASALGTKYVSPYAIALVHTGIGNRDEALRWLERAVDERAWGAAFLNVEADFDPLRSDPRFAALVARMKR